MFFVFLNMVWKPWWWIGTYSDCKHDNSGFNPCLGGLLFKFFHLSRQCSVMYRAAKTLVLALGH